MFMSLTLPLDQDLSDQPGSELFSSALKYGNRFWVQRTIRINGWESGNRGDLSTQHLLKARNMEDWVDKAI